MTIKTGYWHISELKRKVMKQKDYDNYKYLLC